MPRDIPCGAFCRVVLVPRRVGFTFIYLFIYLFVLDLHLFIS